MTSNAGPPVLKLFHTESKVRKIAGKFIAGTEGVVEMNELDRRYWTQGVIITP